MTDAPSRTPREALARALYLRPTPGMQMTDEMFDRNWAMEMKRHDPDSFTGKCAAKADAVLRWIDAAGFKIVPKESDER